MKKFIKDYISNKNKANLIDIDFHELLELKELGLNDSEIGEEIGLSKYDVSKLLRQLEKEI